MKKLICAVALLVMLAFASADLVTNYTFLPSTITPGVTGTVTLTITNPSSTTTVEALTLQAVSTGYIKSDVRRYVGDFGPGASSTVSIPFTVDADAQAGAASLLVNAYWREDANSRFKSIYVPMEITSLSLFQASAYSVAVSPGNAFAMNVTITNTGGDATDVLLHVNSSGFLPNGPFPISLGNIRRGESVSVEVPLIASSGLASGTYSIPITLEYRDDLGRTQASVTSLGPVSVIKSSVDFLVSLATEGDAKPGEKITLHITLNNIGGEDAHRVKMGLAANSTIFAPIAYSERYVDIIPAGENTTMDFEVAIKSGTVPNYYAILVGIDYLDEHGEAKPTIYQNLGVEVTGDSQVWVIASTDPSPLTSGKTYTLSIQISNIGTSPLRALSVETTSDDFQLLDAPEAFIGTLTLDEYSTVQYKIYVPAGTSEGEHPANVRLTFKDAYNQEHVIDEQVMLTVVSSSVTGENGSLCSNPIIIVVGLVVAAVVAYFGYKKYIKKS